MSQNNAHGYEFGPYRLDLAQRVLTRAGEKVALTPKATEILAVLVVNAGQLVEKDALVNQIWRETFLEESYLTQNIFLLRCALGDERPAPKFIETVARRGYRFVAGVRPIGEGGDTLTTNGEHGPNGDNAMPPTVAVLPFINVTRDPDAEYLADGLTENLVNYLSRVSKLRVMLRSAVFRYRKKGLDPRVIGKELGVDVVLVGKITSRPPGIAVGVELVDVVSGWQLWGENFEGELKDLLEIQDAVTRQLLGALKLKLSGDEEKRVTARYTENAEADQSDLEGRYYWSLDDTEARVKLRFEWDWKVAERELNRALELRYDQPTAHQWYAAYRLAKGLSERSTGTSDTDPSGLPAQIVMGEPSTPEQVQICAIAREQIAFCNYEAAAEIVLKAWLPQKAWPKLGSLTPHAAADLLFTLGLLTSSLATTRQTTNGHRRAAALLNGSIALFENLNTKSRSVEARAELARCYYRQGLFDIARNTLAAALRELPNDYLDIQCLGLIYWGMLERDAGRLIEAIGKLEEAAAMMAPDAQRHAQVNETRTRLYMATTRNSLAEEAIEDAIQTFELTDSEAILSEALTTGAVVAGRLGRFADAQKRFESAYKVAERCGDREGARRALLSMFEEMADRFGQDELEQLLEKLKRLDTVTEPSPLSARVKETIAQISL